MATTVALQEGIEIPFVASLEEFRRWAQSDEFPERGRIDYLAGRIEVDLSPEAYYVHGGLRVEMIGVLSRIIKAGDLGDLRTYRTRVSNPEADLSAEPDLVFTSFETFESGRARLIAKATGEAGRYIEVEGSPDLVVEIVSDRSVMKDTVRLHAAYWLSGVTEYWLMDARGEELDFRIYRHGPSGYESAPVDADGHQKSDVFKRSFRLARRRDRCGGWAFDLEHKADA